MNRHSNTLWVIVGVFLLVFIILGPAVSSLRLYIDDFPYLLNQPYLTTQFSQFVAQYAHIHGIYRPFAQLWYWIIYTLYTLSPSVAHLIPWAIHCLTGILIVRILIRHGMIELFALLTGLWYVLFPFAVEQYGWLSATPGTLVVPLFLLMIETIESKITQSIQLLLIAILTGVSLFFYESTFFLPLALLLLIPRNNTTTDHSDKNSFKLLGAIIIPMALYVTSKLLIHGTDSRPLVNSLGDVLSQTNNLIHTISRFIWGYDEYILFWKPWAIAGFTLITQSPYELIFSILFGFILIQHLFYSNYVHQHSNKTHIHFWFICFMLSLPPLIANKEFYFGFRSLHLPLLLACICFIFVCQKILGIYGKRVLAGIMSVACLVWLAINMQMLETYKQQYVRDSTLSKTITTAIEPYRLTKPIILLLKSTIPLTSEQTFLHADYLLSCYYYEWSAPACLKIASSQPVILGIERTDGQRVAQKGYTWEMLESQQPLKILITAYDKVQIQ